MTIHEFNELRQAAAALPPGQMRQLRDELERKLAALPFTAPTDADEEVPDPFWGLMRDDADLMDEIVTEAYRQRREGKWREIDL